jgi:hypothetical protein
VLRRMVPDVPETQIVEGETGERPRNWRVLLVGERVQESFEGLGWAVVVVDHARSAAKRDSFILTVCEGAQEESKETWMDFILLSGHDRPRNESLPV